MTPPSSARCLFGALCLLALLLSGCATAAGKANRDPLEKPNRAFYKVNDTLDRFVMKPVSKVYTHVLPTFVRRRVTNFFSNIGEVNTSLNNFMQGKPKEGTSDLGRFATNSTVGVAGLFDVATKWGLQKHEEDFGQTMGVWGVHEGPYLVIPFFGPSTCRDAPGIAVSSALKGVFFLGASFAIQRMVDLLETVDKRAGAEEQLKAVDQTAVDKYVFIREAYRQHRTYLIYDGNPPVPDLGDESLDEPKDSSPAAAPAQTAPPNAVPHP